MARPLSEEKRTAILESAVTAVASLGLGAPTVKIAQGAGVADGTLFVYFPTTDDLLNRLYLHLKAELREALKVDYPLGAGVKDQFHHFWNRYIEWGSQSPDKHKTIRQLNVWEGLTEESRKASWIIFSDIEDMVAEGFRSGILRAQPAAFLSGIMDGLAGLVLEMVAKKPDKLEEYKHLGWTAFWGAISST